MDAVLAGRLDVVDRLWLDGPGHADQGHSGSGLLCRLRGQLPRLDRPVAPAFQQGAPSRIAGGASILLAWIIPYVQAVGWSNARRLVWFGDPAVTGNGVSRNWGLGNVATHLLTYPLEIAAGTLPWSALLLLFLSGDLRRSLRVCEKMGTGTGQSPISSGFCIAGPEPVPIFSQTLSAAKPFVLFACVCLAIAFPTCWIPPGGQARFFAPLYPCLSVLIGIAVHHATRPEATPAAYSGWQRFTLLVSGLMAVASLAVVVVAAIGPRSRTLAPFAEPPLAALAYTLVSFVLAFLILRARGPANPLQARKVVLALAPSW